MEKFTARFLPSVAAIQTEAARTEAMIAAATQRIESSSEGNLREAMHLQVCRAELHAYLAGLMYSLGHMDMLDRRAVARDYGLSDVQIEDSAKSKSDEDAPRFMECFEC